MESKAVYPVGQFRTSRRAASQVRTTAHVRKASTAPHQPTSLVVEIDLPEDEFALSATIVERLRLAAEQLPAIVLSAREGRFEARLQHLAEAYADVDALDEEYLRLHEAELQSRQELKDSMPMLDAKAVHKLAGHTTTNVNQTAGRWKQAGKIFSVPFAGIDRYPAFQFERGEPRKAIARILELLAPADDARRRDPELEPPFSEWAIAFWFDSANGWLGGRRPVDVLEKDPEAVVRAATHARDRISD